MVVAFFFPRHGTRAVRLGNGLLGSGGARPKCESKEMYIRHACSRMLAMLVFFSKLFLFQGTPRWVDNTALTCRFFLSRYASPPPPLKWVATSTAAGVHDFDKATINHSKLSLFLAPPPRVSWRTHEHRHIFRGRPDRDERVGACDRRALPLAEVLLAKGWQQKLTAEQHVFALMPLRHTPRLVSLARARPSAPPPPLPPPVPQGDHPHEHRCVAKGMVMMKYLVWEVGLRQGGEVYACRFEADQVGVEDRVSFSLADQHLDASSPGR